MKVRLGVDVACRAAHQAPLADEHGVMLWVGHRFRRSDKLKELWPRVLDAASSGCGLHPDVILVGLLGMDNAMVRPITARLPGPACPACHP